MVHLLSKGKVCMDYFNELKRAEAHLAETEVMDSPEVNYASLVVLLVLERGLDSARTQVFEQYGYDSDEAKDYIFREYMVRHGISEFALKLDKSVTDKITGNESYEKSVVATCVRNRELYPKPEKKS